MKQKRQGKYLKQHADTVTKKQRNENTTCFESSSNYSDIDDKNYCTPGFTEHEATYCTSSSSIKLPTVDKILDSSASSGCAVKETQTLDEMLVENIESSQLFENIQSCQLQNAESEDLSFVSDFNQLTDIKEDDIFQDALEDLRCTKYPRLKQHEHCFPIFENAEITYEESMLLIMTFCVRHNLTGAATGDLIKLLSLHCPQNANIVKNLREFNLFVQALKSPLVKHYYCPSPKCQVYNGSLVPDGKTKCCVCQCILKKEHFFIELPIYSQLENLLSSKLT